MTDVSFYHLQRQPLEQALPKLLERVIDSGLRAVVLTDSEERTEALNTSLWVYNPGSFLPHGTARDGNPEAQPIYLTPEEQCPNEANVLVVVDGRQPAFVGDFDRCLDMFDGNSEEAVEQARGRWRAYADAGHAVTYWQQSETGKWEKKG